MLVAALSAPMAADPASELLVARSRETATGERTARNVHLRSNPGIAVAAEVSVVAVFAVAMAPTVPPGASPDVAPHCAFW